MEQLENVTLQDIFSAKRTNYTNEFPETSLEKVAFFEKIARVFKPRSFKELEEKIAELRPEAYKDGLNVDLKKWAEKLVLDRNKLKELFVHEED